MSAQLAAETGRARVAGAFERAKRTRGGALIPYLCAGDPDLETTAALLAALGPAGADVVELGVPYGDPLADGPTIAAAAQRALDGGTTVERALDVVANASRAGAPPIVMFTYYNPVIAFGVERFAEAIAAAGACGAIVPDVPLEETHALRAAFAPHGLALPLLIAPTTPLARAEAIARAGDGFTYLVSRLGVTGARKEPDFAWLEERCAELRNVSATPLAVGFGISSAEHVRRVFDFADGAIVGSALIDAYAGTRGAAAVERVAAYVRGLLAAGNGDAG